MNHIANTTSADATNDSIAINLNTRRNHRLVLASALTAGAVALGFGGSSANAIVAGEATTAVENPWQVSLQSDGEHFCGGSLVSDRIVVTAAHCTQGSDADGITIRAGLTDLQSDDGQTRRVIQINEHQKYVDEVGDIALLVLDRPFDASANISPVKIATAAESTAAITARVTGWGATSEEAEDTPNVLQTADVPMVSDADCALVEQGNDDELCAGGTGTDSCYGDSGGPLTIESARGRVLAGIVSWGEECGGETSGVYAQVENFSDWIAQRIADPDAPQEDRLPTEPSAESDGDDDTDFGDDAIWIEQEFLDQYDGPTDFDDMSDDDLDAFFDAYDEWAEEYASDNPASDDGGYDDNELNDGEFSDNDLDDEFGDDLDDDFEDSAADFDSSEFDTNGDGVVQWSELEALFA